MAKGDISHISTENSILMQYAVKMLPLCSMIICTVLIDNAKTLLEFFIG